MPAPWRRSNQHGNRRSSLWTRSPYDERAGVRRILRRRDVKVEDFEPLIEKFMAQAEELYDDWPLAA